MDSKAPEVPNQFELRTSPISVPVPPVLRRETPLCPAHYQTPPVGGNPVKAEGLLFNSLAGIPNLLMPLFRAQLQDTIRWC